MARAVGIKKNRQATVSGSSNGRFDGASDVERSDAFGAPCILMRKASKFLKRAWAGTKLYLLDIDRTVRKWAANAQAAIDGRQLCPLTSVAIYFEENSAD